MVAPVAHGVSGPLVTHEVTTSADHDEVTWPTEVPTVGWPMWYAALSYFGRLRRYSLTGAAPPGECQFPTRFQYR